MLAAEITVLFETSGMVVVATWSRHKKDGIVR
jgi:hypothetical protein